MKPNFAKHDTTPDMPGRGVQYANPFYTPGDGIARVAFDTISIEHRPATDPNLHPVYPAQLWVAFRYRGRTFVEFPLGVRHITEDTGHELAGLLGSLQLHSV